MIKDKLFNPSEINKIPLEIPLCTNMHLTRLNGKKASSASIKICVISFGPAGLEFKSNKNFNMDLESTYLFESIIAGRCVEIEGDLIARKHESNDVYLYSVKFRNFKKFSIEYMDLVKAITIGLRDKTIYENSNFCLNPIGCYNILNDEQENKLLSLRRRVLKGIIDRLEKRL